MSLLRTITVWQWVQWMFFFFLFLFKNTCFFTLLKDIFICTTFFCLHYLQDILLYMNMYMCMHKRTQEKISSHLLFLVAGNSTQCWKPGCSIHVNRNGDTKKKGGLVLRAIFFWNYSLRFHICFLCAPRRENSQCNLQLHRSCYNRFFIQGDSLVCNAFFLCEYNKAQVYAEKLKTWQHLEANIRRAIADIMQLMSGRVIYNLIHRVRQCVETCSRYLNDVLFWIWGQFLSFKIKTNLFWQLGVGITLNERPLTWFSDTFAQSIWGCVLNIIAY